VWQRSLYTEPVIKGAVRMAETPPESEGYGVSVRWCTIDHGCKQTFWSLSCHEQDATHKYNLSSRTALLLDPTCALGVLCKWLFAETT